MIIRLGGDYRDFVAEFYDLSYEQRGPGSIEFFLSHSKKASGRTLELGCGTGRVLIPTAVAGCEITGLDLSPSMLKECREKLAKQPVEVQSRVRLLQGDMTNFDTGELYSAITMPFRPFQHLISVDTQKACLNCVNKHLAPKGLFVFDVFNPFPPRLVANPEYMVEREDLSERELPDGRRLRRTNRIAGFHRDQQYNDIEIIYYLTYPDGKTKRLVESFPMRYFYRYEVEHLLELGGFKVVDLFGDYDGSAFSEGSPEMIFVSTKR